MMKQYILYFVMAVATLSFATSCADDEDESPSNADENLFYPNAEDNSQLAQLKRDFKQKVGSYLLFNDTLSHVQNGTDAYGNPTYKTELVDVEYALVGSGLSHTHTYKYITNFAEQKKAADLVASKLAPHLGKAVPYSFLIVDSASEWTLNDDGQRVLVKKDTYDDQYPHPQLLLGSRCYMVSIDGGAAFEDDTYFNSLFARIVKDKVGRMPDDSLATFYTYSAKYYDMYYQDMGLTEEYTDEDFLSHGFFPSWDTEYFTYKKSDLEDYEKAITNYTLESFTEEYGTYPLMMAKFKALRKACEGYGIVFD
jgi:hypothetical protein